MNLSSPSTLAEETLTSSEGGATENTLGKNRLRTVIIPHLTEKFPPVSHLHREDNSPYRKLQSKLEHNYASSRRQHSVQNILSKPESNFPLRALAQNEKLNSDFELILNLVVKTCLKFGRLHQSTYKKDCG